MKTIIVPTDFSKTSVNAAQYASDMALHMQMGLLLVHVLPLPLLVSEVPMPPDSFEVSLEESNERLRELKERLERHHNDKLCIDYRAITGSFLDALKKLEEEKDMFAVIMGTSGSGATAAFFLGSFSLTAAKHLEKPLIVVPPGYTYKPIAKLGLACDMKDSVDALPMDAIDGLMAYYEGARMEILYITGDSEKMAPTVLSESKSLMASLAHYKPEVKISAHADIKQGLEEFVAQSGIDLLLLLPKQRNFLEGLFHKSLTKEMVLHAYVPIMIARH